MHVRGEHEPNQVMRRPLTAAQEGQSLTALRCGLNLRSTISGLVDQG